MKQPGVFLLPLDGMLVQSRSLPCNNFRFPQQFHGDHLYSWVWQLSVLLKNTMQCPLPGLEPGPLDVGINTLTMRPVRLLQARDPRCLVHCSLLFVLVLCSQARPFCFPVPLSTRVMGAWEIFNVIPFVWLVHCTWVRWVIWAWVLGGDKSIVWCSWAKHLEVCPGVKIIQDGSCTTLMGH